MLYWSRRLATLPGPAYGCALRNPQPANHRAPLTVVRMLCAFWSIVTLTNCIRSGYLRARSAVRKSDRVPREHNQHERCWWLRIEMLRYCAEFTAEG